MGEELKHWVDVEPSRNWIRPAPARNFGITTCRMTFFVKGPKGAVQWMIGTEWAIEPVRRHLSKFDRSRDDPQQPKGWDLGIHSPTPLYEGQEPMSGDCSVIGGKCYYDGSGLNADAVIEGFLAGGTDWLWPKLEEYYRHVFENRPYPDFTARYLPHPDDAKTTLGAMGEDLEQTKAE